MNGRRLVQARHEVRFGTREIVIFSVALVLIWGLTFAVGMLVGRELGLSSGAGSKNVLGAGGTPPSDRAPRAPKSEGARTEERLTFYQTLTAPTPDLPVIGQPTIEERIVPHETAPTKPAPKGERRPPAVKPAPATPRPAVATSQAPAASPPVASVAPAGTGPTESQLWTVQVSSFRSRALAEELRTQLAARGFDAYVVSTSTEEGRIRHRVRVGGFATRAEADRIATELKSERNLNPFVTTRPR